MLTINDPCSDVMIDTNDQVRLIASKSVRVIRCGNIYATGAAINGDFIADRATVNCCIYANCATINGDFIADRATVNGSVYLAGATINGSVYLSDATIRDCFRANTATITGKIDAHNAIIEGTRITDPTPEEAARIKVIVEHISKPGALEMRKWHTCAAIHCIAGWAQWLFGDMGASQSEEGKRLIPSLSYLFYTTNDIVRKALDLPD